MELLINIYMTPLYLAVLNGSTEIVKLLIQNPKIDANIRPITFYFFDSIGN